MVTRDNTHKKNIVNNIFKKVGLPSSYAAKLVNDLIIILITNLISKKKFKIKNFGTFDLKKKKKREGRNPKNKIIHEILERNIVTFKAAEKLKKKLNTDVKK
jgi:nucleoid DNA-binding protein|tara:strand:+ start:1093 stop:1398 length:306 start_codon:yes stop_codon:yes gene_type:complete